MKQGDIFIQNNIKNYIDISNKKLKVCKNYDTQYFNNPLPKGCIYGRPTKNLYIYVDNLWQFNPKYGLTQFVIWVLDQRKDVHFHETVVSKYTEWYNMIYAYIAYHELFDAKVEPLLCRIGKKPERKQPQTYDGYNYNVPYRHRRTLEWEDKFTTERGVCETPVAYVDTQKAQKIAKKQKAINKSVASHTQNYKRKIAQSK